MACIKLDILNDKFAPLKVVYRKGHGCEKMMQRFIRVDPMTETQEAWSPYHFNYGNPVNYIDFFGLEPESMNNVALCPTCPPDKKFDEARNSKDLYVYDSESGTASLQGPEVTVTAKRRNNSNSSTGFIFGIGNTLNYLGDNNITTRGKFGGATPGTSIASQYFRSKLGDKKTPQALFKMLPKRIGRSPLRSNNLGAVAGRTVPLLGRGFVGLSVGMSIYNVATSENTAQALTVETAGWTGAYLGAEGGAAAGAAIGVWFCGVGAVPGAIIGGIIGAGAGYILGAEAGQAVYDKSNE